MGCFRGADPSHSGIKKRSESKILPGDSGGEWIFSKYVITLNSSRVVLMVIIMVKKFNFSKLTFL